MPMPAEASFMKTNTDIYCACLNQHLLMSAIDAREGQRTATDEKEGQITSHSRLVSFMKACDCLILRLTYPFDEGLIVFHVTPGEDACYAHQTGRHVERRKDWMKMRKQSLHKTFRTCITHESSWMALGNVKKAWAIRLCTK